MAEVTSMKNGSWMVLWSFNLTETSTGSTTFQCTGQIPEFQMTYIYIDRSAYNPASTFSVQLKTFEKKLSNQEYPVLATAVLDGMATEMKQLTKGLWDEVKWTYSRPQEYDNYNSAGNQNVQPPFWLSHRRLQEYENHRGARTRNTHLTLILQFPQIACHRFHPAESYIINQFTNLLESQAMADLKFIVKGQEMAAHAVILASASPVMTAMLEPGKFKEGQSKKVEINDIEPEVFQQLLRYVYTGRAPKLEDETITEPLFLAADKYQMDKIKEHCEEILIHKLSLENVVRYLVMAHLHSAGRLQEASIKFLVGCRNEIWDRPEWKNLNNNYPELFYLASRRMVKNT